MLSRRGCASASNHGEAEHETFVPDGAERQRLNDQLAALMPSIAHNQGAATRRMAVVAPERISADY